MLPCLGEHIHGKKGEFCTLKERSGMLIRNITILRYGKGYNK